MDRNVLGMPASAGSAVESSDRQRVLRNTYWLLAFSMIPTVLGAWVGVQSGILAGIRPGFSALLFLGGAFAFMFGIERTKNSGAGVLMLLGFTAFMGLMLSRLIGFALNYSNGAQLVMIAFGGTGGIFLCMATLATVVKRDLSGLAKFLFVGALLVFAAGLINLFVQSSALMLTLSVGVMAIFSLYMLVDVRRVIDGGETNYVMATLAIYLDLYNVFQSLLMLLLSFGGGSSNRN